MKKAAPLLLLFICFSCAVQKVDYKVLFDHKEALDPLKKVQLIEGQKELNKVYAVLNRTRMPGLPVPRIDFSTYNIIAFSAKTKQNPSTSELIKKVYDKNQEIHVVLNPDYMAAKKDPTSPKFSFYILKIEGSYQGVKVKFAKGNQ